MGWDRLSKKNRKKSRQRLLKALSSGPPRFLWDEIKNVQSLWSSAADHSRPGESSLTDEPGFLGAVAEVLLDDHKASRFRSNTAIINTYDHVSRLQGLSCLLSISARGKAEELHKLRDLSDFGTPAQFHYESLGRFSPTVLRFAKIALDLHFFFPDLPALTVAEIGVGFGGQAVAVNELIGSKNFVFYDLPEVNALASRSVNTLTDNVTVELQDGRNPKSSDGDLIVSNYAFSEMSRNTQDKYLENVILPSKRGFMIYNTLSEKKLSGYNASEVAEMLPGAATIPEEPTTHPDNVLLIWGSPRLCITQSRGSD